MKYDDPYPYQWEGVHWLASMRKALLADEPGLGKTAQAILAMDFIKAQTILIICPASARFVWREEIKKWSMFGHNVHVMTSMKDEPIEGMVNVVNYDLLQRGFQKKSYKFNPFMKRFLAIEWDVVIADEAHFMKEKDSLRTRAVLSTRGIHGKTKRLWLLTGTPMPNHPGELWAILASLGATQLSHGDFVKEYCTVGTYSYAKGKPQGAKQNAIDDLNEMLEKVMKRRLKEFVMPELPAIRIDDFPVPEVKIDLAQFFEEALADPKSVKKKIAAQEDFVSEVWSKSVASGGAMNTGDMVKVLESVGASVALYRRWLGAVKAVSVGDILYDELDMGAVKKVVIFAHHKQVIAHLKNRLKEFKPQVIDGSVSAEGREKAVHNFQKKRDCRVFIGQTIAAGTAITLTAAHEVVVVEEDWVPANNAQAIMRCHRIGQMYPVRVRFARLADTLDDYICETVMRKTKDIVRILGD